MFSLVGRSRGNDGSRLRRRRWARSSTKDARAVAVSLLANKRRRELSGQVMAKVTETTLFLDTVSFKTELIKQHAFLNRVRKLRKDKDVKREARALVTEECASTSDQSENTVHVTDDVARK